MPLFEYVCTKCHHKFEAMLTLQEHESKQAVVPSATAAKLSRMWPSSSR
jgi:putative FmdB family regulatory protein